MSHLHERLEQEVATGPLAQAYGRYTAMEAAMGALQGHPSLEAEQAAHNLIEQFSSNIRDDSAVMWVSLLRLADRRSEARAILLDFIAAYSSPDGDKRDRALHQAYLAACENVDIQVVIQGQSARKIDIEVMVQEDAR